MRGCQVLQRRPVVLILALGVVLALLMVVGCGGGAKEKATSGGKTLEVELDDYYFKPKTLSLTAGQPVTLKLENEGKNTHSFTISDLGIDNEVEAGKTKQVTVTPNKNGSFQLICRYHQASNNMVGTVSVQ